ncbi:MAG: hypothetical protein VB835_02145, partial [Pirellulales bacterium]
IVKSRQMKTKENFGRWTRSIAGLLGILSGLAIPVFIYYEGWQQETPYLGIFLIVSAIILLYVAICGRNPLYRFEKKELGFRDSENKTDS